jgi:hypothetical protein
MEERTNRVVHVARIDVESTLVRSKRKRLLAIEPTMPSGAAHGMKGWPIAYDVCPPIHRIVASGYASR